MHWSANTLRVVRGGMHDVIEAETGGTGKRAKRELRWRARQAAEFGTQTQRRKHTWMTVFAPFDHPRYTVAMVLDEGESGGKSVAPLINALMTGIFNLENSPTNSPAGMGGAG